MAAPLKTLLIYVPETRYDRFNPNIRIVKPSLKLLYSYLRSRGLEAEFLDLEVELGHPADEEELFQRARGLIAEREFDVAAISCFFSGVYLSAVAIARLCREQRPEATIVMGGYHPTAVPEDFTGPGSVVDFVVRGEGEYFLESLARGEVARGGATRVIDGKGLELGDSFPLRWESLLPPRLEPKYVNFPLSRGCPYQCAFCMEPTSVSSPRWRAASVEQSLAVVDELNATWKPSWLMFCDPLFGFNKQWRHRFLEALARRSPGPVWGFETRVDALGPADLDLAARLDLLISLGVETASEQMLVRMHKTSNPKDYLKRLEEILTYPTPRPLFFNINLLFNHPGETPESVDETLSFFERILPRLRHNVALWPINFILYPGNPLYSSMDEYRRLYGTKMSEMRWWTRKVKNQERLAQSIIASREMEAAFGEGLDFWQQRYLLLRDQLLDRWDARGKLMCAVWSTAARMDTSRVLQHVSDRQAAEMAVSGGKNR